MKNTIKYYCVRMLAGLLRGVASARHVLAGFFRIFAFPFVVLGRVIFLILVLPSYRVILALRRLLAKVLTPAKNKVLFFFGHRYVVHIVMFGIVGATCIFNLKNYALRAEAFGEQSILHSLVAGQNEVPLVEQSAELTATDEEVYSYFGIGAVSATQNVAASLNVAESPGAIYSGSALVKPSVMGESASVAPRTGVEKYVVEDGDTIDGIARRKGVSIATVLAANNLTLKSLIHPGDELIILPFTGTRHIVKKGDTLLSIATRYGGDAEEIAKANKFTLASTLSTGDEILIPGGTLPAPAPVKIVATRTAAEPRVTTAAPVQKLFTEPVKPVASEATGKYVWPTSKRLITQYYSYRHTGVDIDGVIGDPIYATADGTVEFAGWATGYGLSIVVNHGGGIWSRYGHTSKMYVKIGDSVKQGQTIALMGDTGQSTGSHLHFEILTGPRVFKNPLKYIK